MSHEASLWVRSQKVGGNTAKHVLMIIADHAGQDLSCYLRTRLIAAEAEIGESTVRAGIAKLVEGGFIRVYERYHNDGARRSNRYQVLTDGAATPEPDAEDWADVRGLVDGGSQQTEGADDSTGHPLQEQAGFPNTEASKEAPTKKGGAAAKKIATRVPDDFQPTDAMRAWFVAEQLGNVIDGKREHEQFMDYWRAEAGVKARKLDWPATWRRWMRKAAADASSRRPAGAPGNSVMPAGGPMQPMWKQSTTDQRIAQGQALAAKYREQGL